ncbi:glycosyltransferase family 2 protein [Neobacillus sp. NPDC058068]|uniref:glycosyltransferase family 2 protein n=1 Tax=Neobacillus sp. NPDC058068 TaxID=3346325 RepID=UPI0036DEDCCA
MKSYATVLIPSYNPGNYLRKAVDSVFKQTYEKWKLIIIDDASTDNSLSTIKDRLKDPRVKLIRNPINVGQSKAQNEGLKYVDTPFLLMLDSDDWLFRDTLQILVNESKRVSDDVALICGNKRIIYEDKDGKIIDERTREYGRDFDDKYEFILANYVPYPRFYRTAALRYVGGWPTDDPYEGRYLEDQRMDHRLIEHFKIHWIDYMLYNYRRHSSNTSSNLAIMNEMYEWLVLDSLKRWGDHYQPVFEYSHGWLLSKKLIPKIIED